MVTWDPLTIPAPGRSGATPNLGAAMLRMDVPRAQRMRAGAEPLPRGTVPPQTTGPAVDPVCLGVCCLVALSAYGVRLLRGQNYWPQGQVKQAYSPASGYTSELRQPY